MSTFRRIGSRVNLQGGSNYTNLLVVNQLSAGYNFNNEPRPENTNPLPIQLNPTESLIQGVIDALKLNTTFLANLSTNALRVFIRQQLTNLSAVALLVQPFVVTNLLAPSSDFINGLAQILATDFLPLTKTLLLGNATFRTTSVQSMIQYISTIEANVSSSTINLFANNILLGLSEFTNFPFRRIFTDFIPPYILQNEEITANYTKKYVSTRNYYVIPPFYLYNNRVIPFLELEINARCVYNLIITTTPFVTSTNTNVLTRINISAIRKDSFENVTTLFNQVYSPAVATTNELNFTGQLVSYEDVDIGVYICVTCYLSNGSYVTSSITTFINKTKEYSAPVYGELRYAADLSLTQYETKQRDNEDSIIETYTVLNNEYRVVVPYKVEAPFSPAWWFYLNVLDLKCQTDKDLSTYVVARSNRANFTYIKPSSWTYNRGDVLQLVKFNSEATAQWSGVITPNAIPVGAANPEFKIIDLSIDSKSKIYVSFSHKVGNWNLVAIRSTNNNTLTIDTQNTPLTRENSFVTVFDYDGSIFGSMKIYLTSSDLTDYVNLNHIFVPEFSNAVYIAVSRDDSNDTLIKQFDNTVFTVPSGTKTFIAKVRNYYGSANQWSIRASTPQLDSDKFLKIFVVNGDNVISLFYTNGYPIEYYGQNVSSVSTTLSTRNMESDDMYKTYSLAYYLSDGGFILWAIWISSKSFIESKAEMLSVQSLSLFVYVLLPLESNENVYFNNTNDGSSIRLPITVTPSTFSYILMRIGSSGNLQYYAIITNAKNAKMKLYPRDAVDAYTLCLVDFEYTDTFYVYGNSNIIEPSFEYGQPGDQGNALVLFDPLLTPTYMGRTSPG